MSHPQTTLWLSCHVDYACRHSGACCRAGWPLPVEARVVPAIDAAVADGRLSLAGGGALWLAESADAPDDVAGTLRQADGGCVFHHQVDEGRRGASRRCAVHARLGHAALPSTCQHFPRVCLVDERTVRVSLSHYCPTAAAMLVDHSAPVSIVDGSPAVPGLDVPEGLDVRGELPPRLTDGVLMDREGLDAWERHVVETLAGPHAAAGAAEDVVARVTADAWRLRSWTPGGPSLAQAVAALDDARDEAEVARARAIVMDPDIAREAVRVLAATCRPPWTWTPPVGGTTDDRQLVAPGWQIHAPAVRRYLAAKAFGAWPAYQADATTGLAAWLHTCLDVLRVECTRICAAEQRMLDRDLFVAALRQADLVLVHYADTLAWARTLSS